MVLWTCTHQPIEADARLCFFGACSGSGWP